MELNIGIDDTDTRQGGCTTYIAAVLNDELARIAVIKELKLVRLNPNIPWKTRGNGAVALKLQTEHVEDVLKISKATIETYSALGEENTNPGAAFLKGEPGKVLQDFYRESLTKIVSIDKARHIAECLGIGTLTYGNGRGLIGALAAIGADLHEHTYELTAYRRPENWGTPRNLDIESVHEMDRMTSPDTYNNIDPETGRILITPRSSCPILYGVRSRTRQGLELAKSILKTGEPVERYALFKTNQGTDSHLIETAIGGAEPFSNVIVKGKVSHKPRTIMGGHVIFRLADETDTVDCAAYEPTGSFREIVKQLMPNDIVKAYGGVRNTRSGRSLTINLEKLDIMELAKTGIQKNPPCPTCGKRMKSMGKEQGYRCKKCRTHADKKESNSVKRDLEIGIYSVPPRAMRHLSKPIERA